MARAAVLLLAVVVTAIAIAAPARAFTWAPCTPDEGPGGVASAPPPRLTPSAVTLVPDPPQIGSSVVFGIEGTVSAGPSIASGTIGLRVKFEGVDLYQEEGPLCEKVATGCPLGGSDGSASSRIEYTQDLPPIAPPGHYSVRVIGTTGASTVEGDTVVCVDVDFDMVVGGGGGGEGGGGAAAAVVAVV